MYNILSLDGGGSWSLLQLLTLKERFQEELPDLKGHDILQKFDMIIANSGGSIVLAALAENWSIDEAITLFDDKAIRESIFSKNRFKETFWPVSITRMFGFGPKYSSKRKGEAFKRLFPKIDKILMHDIPMMVGKDSLKLIVCAYDALNNRAKFFRSYTIAGSDEEQVRLTQAIHGSSNAPIQYFDFPARFKAKGSEIFYELWDGALGGFNNPVVAGLIEAYKLGIPLERIQIISIGTGNRLMSIGDKKRFYKTKQITLRERNKKYLFWRYGYQTEYFKNTVLNQAKTILYQPPDWANYVALMFLLKTSDEDISNRFIRLSPMIHVDSNTNPHALEIIEKLYYMDMDLTVNTEIELLKVCFEKWKSGEIKNQPLEYHVERNNDLVYKKGDKYFENAMAKWKNIQ
ncbi:MAG: patatin-like phospholipase family protein [Saonia sp.]